MRDARCDVCGNGGATLFRVVTRKGIAYSFDSFSCAIRKLAPRCEICGARLVVGGADAEEATSCSRCHSLEERAIRGRA
jgi:hypothetical protein